MTIKGKRERTKEGYIQNRLILLKRLRNNAESDKDKSEIGLEIWTRYDAQIRCLEEALNAFQYYDEHIRGL